MKIYLSNAEMRAADEATISGGTPSEELMARAGRAIAREVALAAVSRGAKSVLFVCGTGNNGGDGYVAARLLRGSGLHIMVYGLTGRLSADCEREKARYDGEYSSDISADIIVDCIFGTGLCREVTGEHARIIERINASGAYVISADIPSGLNGDNGKIMGVAVRANLTVAIACPKLGHVLGDGIDLCGERLDRDIGIKAEEYAVTSPEDGDISAFFPERKRNSHKGTYGSCQIVAGDCYVGAAALSVSSALLSGCGYVSAAVGERLKYALVAAYPQVIYSDGINFSASATAIGMGCGCNKTTYEKVCNLIEGYGGKLIIDADGINSLAAYGKEVLKGAKCKIVITPHVREFSRISGCTEEEILSDPAGRAKAFAAEYGVVVHLKNCVTLTTDGHKVSLVTRGSSALARAGSGDILSGLVAGYAARGLDVFDAAVCAQYVLGRAAEIAGKECGEYCTTSQDIIKNIKNVVKSLT